MQKMRTSCWRVDFTYVQSRFCICQTVHNIWSHVWFQTCNAQRSRTIQTCFSFWLLYRVFYTPAQAYFVLLNMKWKNQLVKLTRFTLYDTFLGHILNAEKKEEPIIKQSQGINAKHIYQQKMRVEHELCGSMKQVEKSKATE